MEASEIKAISKAVAMLVSGCGVAVAYCWVGGWTWLASLHEGWTSMKFSTAICFALSGLMFSVDAQNVRFALSLAVLVIMLGTVLIPVPLGDSSPYAIAPGMPSLVTVASFILLVIAAWQSSLQRAIGAGICVMAAIALAGYALGNPWLWYYWPPVSGGMAVPTALLFLILGGDLIFQSRMVRMKITDKETLTHE